MMGSQPNSGPMCTCSERRKNKSTQIVAQMQYEWGQDKERYGEQSECPRCRWLAETGKKEKDLCECDSDLAEEVIRRRDSQDDLRKEEKSEEPEWGRVFQESEDSMNTLLQRGISG